MKKLIVFLLVIFTFQFGVGQNNKNQDVDIVSHEVKLGETVRMISKKYLVDPAEIYKLNKAAIEGIHEGMLLQIPVPHKEPETVADPVAEIAPETAAPAEEQPVAEKPASKPKPVREKPIEKDTPTIAATNTSPGEHTVASGETLYSLAKKYGVSVNDIKNANPGKLDKGFKIGQVIAMPAGGNQEAAQTNATTAPTVTSTETPAETSPVKSAEKEVTAVVPGQSPEGSPMAHTVARGETLYSLARKYGLTVDDLKAQNPDLQKRGLQIGQVLSIKKN